MKKAMKSIIIFSLIVISGLLLQACSSKKADGNSTGDNSSESNKLPYELSLIPGYYKIVDKSKNLGVYGLRLCIIIDESLKISGFLYAIPVNGYNEYTKKTIIDENINGKISYHLIEKYYIDGWGNEHNEYETIYDPYTQKNKNLYWLGGNLKIKDTESIQDKEKNIYISGFYEKEMVDVRNITLKLELERFGFYHNIDVSQTNKITKQEYDSIYKEYK